MNDEILLKADFDPKVKIYWYCQGLFLQFGLIIAVVGLVTFPLWLLFGWFVVSRQFANIEAVLLPSAVHVKRGAFFRSEKTIPLEKIVDLSLHTGPLLQAFGLASVQIETAGGSAQTGADLVLPGLRNATEFRDAVLEQRLKHVKGEVPAHTTGPSSIELLTEIRDSLARIEEGMKDRG